MLLPSDGMPDQLDGDRVDQPLAVRRAGHGVGELLEHLGRLPVIRGQLRDHICAMAHGLYIPPDAPGLPPPGQLRDARISGPVDARTGRRWRPGPESWTRHQAHRTSGASDTREAGGSSPFEIMKPRHHVGGAGGGLDHGGGSGPCSRQSDRSTTRSRPGPAVHGSGPGRPRPGRRRTQVKPDATSHVQVSCW